MKIFQIVTKRQYRGAEVFAANLSKELIKLGHEVWLIGLYKNEKNTLEVPGAKHLDLIDNKPTGYLSTSLLKNFRALVKKEQPNVIQSNGSDTLKYTVFSTMLLKNRPKLVYRNISIISNWIQGSTKLKLYQFFFKQIDHVSCVGEEARKDFIKTLNYPAEKTSVIRRGIPVVQKDKKRERENLKRELSLKKEDQIIVHVGNFSPEKNHEFLIELFRSFKTSHPHYKLILVGEGITFEEIQKKIKINHLENTVFTLGFRKDIPNLLAAADCLVLCSKVEGVPGVILEAGVQKTPAVANDVGGVKEVLIDRETGFLIPNLSISAFKTKIKKLLENRETRIELSEKAFRLVEKSFNPEKNAAVFVEIYHSLIEK